MANRSPAGWSTVLILAYGLCFVQDVEVAQNEAQIYDGSDTGEGLVDDALCCDHMLLSGQFSTKR